MNRCTKRATWSGEEREGVLRAAEALLVSEMATDHRFETCALCKEVLALRAREARLTLKMVIYLDTHCPHCQFLAPGHTPDCVTGGRTERAGG